MNALAVYGSFLEVAFALNLISTWTGFYQTLVLLAQDVQENASSDSASRALAANLGRNLKRLKTASQWWGLAMSAVVFLFLLYGIPWESHRLALTFTLWLSGGGMPLLSLILYLMVRHYYPLRLRSAAKWAEEARRALERMEEEFLERAESEGRIIRLDKTD